MDREVYTFQDSGIAEETRALPARRHKDRGVDVEAFSDFCEQLDPVAVSRELFAQILDRIDRLRLVPDTG